MQFRSHEEMLVQASRMYYEQELTQAEIGRRLSVSRSTVSRLLSEARDIGIVKISINYPGKRNYSLEEKMLERFRIREVRVLDTLDLPNDEVLVGMGILAAEFLQDFVYDGMVLGVSYGRAIASTVQALKMGRRVDLTVVQILGALGINNPLVEGPDLVRQMANVFNASTHFLYTPLIVESEHMRDLLLQEPHVKQTLDIARSANAIILGIGAHEAESSSWIYTGFLNKKELAFLRSRGAVGHMCAQHFDLNGNVLDVESNKRVISLEFDALDQVETVIAVAGTKDKSMAVYGALKSEKIDVLITDDSAAEKVLNL